MRNTISEIQVSYSNGNDSKTKITGSDIAYKLFLSFWSKGTIELQEEFKILLLNRSNHVLGIYPISRGGVSGTLVDPKLVFSVALKCNASNIILAHNHPSGNLKPSKADELLTQKLIKAGSYLDIKVLDHLIITSKGYFSFLDENLIV
ncbi:JAB domain-containing protein [Gramella jeungdoensis]|uniref:JAB domain-containing protein n=1 Tax=Gramella jeungdoensis TaxID=708091 RepID=A0ABT0Z1E9_9FLAO|nr:JAB domain-containing protein [Gramella jeungdoensis]MCM8569536.1 JAB domain-containing protein [Gramella jeungdoensis]